MFRFRYGDRSLPIDLFTDNYHRRGLRARVIRILFYLNPVLMEKIKPPVAPQYEPYTLQGMQLLYNWHEVLVIITTKIHYCLMLQFYRNQALCGITISNY